MARAALQSLGSSIVGGVAIGPAEVHEPPLDSSPGEHPVPGAGSEAAGRRALEVARSVPPDGHLLVLLSGGASSLAAVPAPGLTVADKARTAALLMQAGADIQALNTVRKHLSSIKGGWLAAAARSPVTTWALSDVIGDDLSVIGSGPTVPDPSTYQDALDLLRRFGGAGRYPAVVTAHLEAGARGARRETPKPGDPRLGRSTASVIGGRADAMRGAAKEAQARGYHTVVIDEALVGEARLAGPRYLARVRDTLVGHAPRPTCVVSSGETTVTVVGEGRGGRNQELVLSMVEPLAVAEQPVVVASVGTDGVDGPTDAAGAIADPTSRARADGAGLGLPGRFLERNDAYAFFEAIGDLVRVGPTGTNVGDLQVILLA
jgi:hydroxypyruvate reductase